MDTLDSIEFIDLSDVDEKERLWILNFLHSWDPNVQVPWKKPNQSVKNIGSLENISTDFHLKSHHSANVALIEENNGHDRNSLNPLTQHLYPTYPVIPYHNQPVYPNVMYPAPINTSINAINNYPQHIQVIPSTVNNNHYIYNNAAEHANIHHNSGYRVEQNVSQISNNEVIGTYQSNDGDYCHQENGEYNSPCNTIQEPKRDEKELIIPKPVSKSWASLFSQKSNKQEDHNDHKETNGKSNEIEGVICAQGGVEMTVKSSDGDSNMKNNYNDPVYYRLGEFLTDHEIDHRTISLQPRGLINRSNYCYINSILQALLACPPVYNLLSGLAEIMTTNAKRKLTPVIYNMSIFVKEFQHLPAAQRVSRRSDKNQKIDPNSLINCDTPFEPGYIYKMLSGMRNDTFIIEGRQEDAEEFLGCLLNGLNDEMLELMKLINNQGPKSTNEVINVDTELDREWKEVMGKNKGCVTRRTEHVQTPISDIFNGHLRSRVHRTGDKSTDNVQPFFTLQLNIEKVTSVKEALEALVCKNQLEGVTSSKTNEEVEAWQQVTIEDLPYVLILHLKCFDYKLDGCTKIIKALDFPIDLKVDGKLLSSKTNLSPKAKQYKLFAIVYHDGKEASKGHYLTDAYHVGYGRWLRYDDASVKAVAEEQVLNPHGTRVPYLLFYRRNDSIRSK